MKVNMVKAFKMRNLIKKHLCELHEMLSKSKTSLCVEDYVALGNKVEDIKKQKCLNDKTIDQVLGELITTQTKLAELNSKIDNANAGNREYLHLLDAVNAEVKYLGTFELASRNFKPTEMCSVKAPTATNPYETKQVLFNNELLFDAEQVKSSIQKLKREKLELEDKIAEVNASTFVELNSEFEDWYKVNIIG